MRLYNKGERIIVHSESHVPGAACLPKKLFTVSDKLGAKLKSQYRDELESLEDAQQKFAEPTSGVKSPASAPASDVESPVSPSTATDAEAAGGEAEVLDPPATEQEIADAKNYGVSVKEMRDQLAEYNAKQPK